MIYTFVLVEFIGLTALAAGLAYRHSGGLFVIDPPEHIFALVPPERALRVYMESLPLLAFSMATVSSIGFLCSCYLPEHPLLRELEGLLHHHAHGGVDALL
jgi:hypothetical protein